MNLNSIGRICLKTISGITPHFYRNLSRKWIINGVANINFPGFNFKMKIEGDDLLVH